jgi:hypothetical protein
MGCIVNSQAISGVLQHSKKVWSFLTAKNSKNVDGLFSLQLGGDFCLERPPYQEGIDQLAS